jgi:hypothetical protein
MNMKKLNPGGVGLVVGSTFGLFHLFWSFLVMTGWAQGLLDFVLSLHFISNPFVIQTFDMGRALMLVVMTFAVGYVLGWIFTCIWNMMMKK